MSESAAPQGFAVIPRAVLYSPAIPTDAKLVYLVLSSHVGKNDTAWPSHAEIARVAGISPAQVKRMLGKLRSAGLVDWRPRKNPRNPAANMSNEYWLIAGARATPAPPDPSSTRPPSRQSPVTPDPGSGGAETPVTESYERESLNESHKKIVRLPPNVDAIFDQFWGIYPRREAKGAAKAAFVKVLRTGIAVEVLMRGATRLRDDPNLPEKQFICHPTTWLNQHRWDDDPLPARTDGRPPVTDRARAVAHQPFQGVDSYR